MDKSIEKMSSEEYKRWIKEQPQSEDSARLAAREFRRRNPTYRQSSANGAAIMAHIEGPSVTVSALEQAYAKCLIDGTIQDGISHFPGDEINQMSGDEYGKKILGKKLT